MDSDDLVGAFPIKQLKVFEGDKQKTFEIPSEEPVRALVYGDGSVTIVRDGHVMMIYQGSLHFDREKICYLDSEAPFDGCSPYTALQRVTGSVDIVQGVCEVHLGVDPLPLKNDAVSALNPLWGLW
ncbi:hypothetical protein [Castellaniella sp.]|uniref:hypothetical protein n=1 Tax=Castellaniella sp. TaxID=1955812 RepID=UPI002AFE846C|nr:hypothetical protein [Castellaniella sp.]